MKDFVREYLEGLGYSVNGRAQGIIQECDDWYSNRSIEGFHKRSNLNGAVINLTKLNFAKRCCADDANLCEIISVAPEKTSQAEEFINKIIKDNRFETRYREQLEKTSATGTVGAYIYLDNADYMASGDQIKIQGGDIRINYVDAECIIPLTVDNGLVTECAFSATNKYRGKDQTTLVIFTKNNGTYSAATIIFDDAGNVAGEAQELQLGEVKPFSIMQNAEVNNIDYMEGYGLPKIYNNIWLFKACDLCFNLLYGDLDKGDKLLFINELLACIKTNEAGEPYLTPQQKEIFILLGEKLPDKPSLIYEYNPEIRVDQITKAFELVLSLISMQFGYGTKKYSFENGQITTATEYIGERQDEMQELNKQRQQAEDYICDLIKAAEWFSNQFHGTNYDTDEDLTIEFDDSYVEDKVTKLDNMRTDALQFPDIPILKIWYIMEKYNLPEEEARGYIEGQEITEDDEWEEEPEEELEEDEEGEAEIEALLAELEAL